MFHGVVYISSSVPTASEDVRLVFLGLDVPEQLHSAWPKQKERLVGDPGAFSCVREFRQVKVKHSNTSEKSQLIVSLNEARND